MPTKPTLSLRGPSQFTYRGSFTAPDPRLVDPTGEVFSSLLGELQDIGAQLVGGRLETSLEDLGQASLVFPVLAGEAWVGLRPGDVTFYCPPFEAHKRNLIVELLQLFQSLRKVAPQLSFFSHELGFNTHAQLQSLAVEDFLRVFLEPAPPAIGPVARRRVSYFLDRDEARLGGEVTIEQSLLDDRDIYVSSVLTLDGTSLTSEDILPEAKAQLQSLVRHKDLPFQLDLAL